MKEIIIEILGDHSDSQQGKTYEYRCVLDNDFEDVAGAIIKLLVKNNSLEKAIVILEDQINVLSGKISIGKPALIKGWEKEIKELKQGQDNLRAWKKN